MVICYASLLALIGCNKQVRSEYCIENTEIVSIDLSRIDEDTTSFYDFFNRIDLFQLDTSNHSSLKADGVYRCAFKEDMVFILEKGNDIYLFCLNQGISKGVLNKKGRGEGEYLFPEDLLINEFSNTLDVLDVYGKIISFSLESFEPIRSLSLPDGGYPYDSFELYDNEKYLVYSHGDFRYAMYDAITGKTIVSDYSSPEWLTYSVFSFRATYSPFILSGEGISVFDGVDGTIYGLDTTTMDVRHCIKWDMGNNQFGVNRLKANKDAVYYYQVSQKNQDRFASPFTNIIKKDEFFFANFLFKGSYHTLIYDTSTKNYRVLQLTSEGIPIPVGYYYNNAIYEFANPTTIDYMVNRNVLDGQGLKVYDAISGSPNLILIKYTFK